MYSNPPPTANVAEVSTAHSSFDHRHSRRIGPTSIGVAWRKTFCFPRADPSAVVFEPPRDPQRPPRRSIQNTVLRSSDYIANPSGTLNPRRRERKFNYFFGFLL